MNLSHGLIMLGFGLLMVLFQVVCADGDNFLTVRQMQLTRGLKKGLPLMWHAGIWGDFVILTPLLTYIVARYGDQWLMPDIILASAIGVAILLPLGWTWIVSAKNGTPEAHTHDGKMTAAGFFHAIYFIAAIAIILLTYFHTVISQTAASTIAIFLGIHVVYGTHIVLGLMAPPWYPDRPHKNPVTWIIILVCWAALIWRCVTI